MKLFYPISATVKKGGKDTIKKLHFGYNPELSISDIEPCKVQIHFGLSSFVNPTPKEWSTYHSFNNSKTISVWLSNNGYSIGDVITFVYVEDSDGFHHFIHV